jgi:hypothetical protein
LILKALIRKRSVHDCKTSRSFWPYRRSLCHWKRNHVLRAKTTVVATFAAQQLAQRPAGGGVR